MSIIEDAQKGHITPEMEFVARSENVDSQKIRKLIAAGRLVILKNANRDTTHPSAPKSMTAVKYGADLDAIRKDILNAVRALFQSINVAQPICDSSCRRHHKRG
ncbi:MAG: phosphomethylpyrimidine synthase ThiC [Methanocellales archaeon]|nr:phosphomethylpyrimidine synthase ThiC [Methanocellales archaeon]